MARPSDGAAPSQPASWLPTRPIHYGRTIMKRLASIAAVLCGTLALQVAQADTDSEGIYVGMGVGEVNVKINDVDSLTTTIDRYQATDTAYKAFVGWRFNPNFAAELVYQDLGAPDSDVLPGVRVRTTLDGIAPNFVGTLPLGPFELFANVGYFFYNFEVQTVRSTGTTKSSYNGSNFTYGGGIGVKFFKRLNFRLQYDTLEVQKADNVHSLWLNAAWHF
jgi:opacity protein-like surface antigen